MFVNWRNRMDRELARLYKWVAVCVVIVMTMILYTLIIIAG